VIKRLLAAFSPLRLFALVAPKDPARIIAHDARYAGGERGGIDVYAPLRSNGAAPVAIFFYGGSWDTGHRKDYRWVARTLAAQGFLTLVPDYRIFPDLYPSFLEDGAAAVRWAAEHAERLGGDPARIVLIGHSAGAYNAAMLALDPRWGVSSLVRAFAGLSGPYAFLPLASPVTTRTFGEAEDLPAAQPLAYARGDAPSAFLATGEKDTLVRPRNTRKLAAALRDAGARVEERHYEGMGHAGPVLALSRLYRRRSTLLAEMVAFLRTAVD
jgi:acetyl esterase/lipase